MTTNAILSVPLAGSEPLKSGSKARRPRQQLHDLMRKALEGHWVVAKKEYGVSLDSRTVLGKHRRNTANHPIRFRGSLRAQSVLVALQRLVRASTSNHRIVGGTLHDPDSAPPSVALAVRLNCQQGQTTRRQDVVQRHSAEHSVPCTTGQASSSFHPFTALPFGKL